jgi:xylulokinase
MYSIGYDIGSSSIKAAVIDLETGNLLANDYYPKSEMEIISVKQGYAEQNPDIWWENLKSLSCKIVKENKINSEKIKCIGISYQMHGLVLIDKDCKVLRPAIIWCDSRAVEIGDNAFADLGENYCMQNLLNSPGNFTVSKLKWVKENEKSIYEKIYKILLPGDFIALKLTGEPVTTIPGLTEGVFWDFAENKVSDKLLNYYGLDYSLLPEVKPAFSEQGYLTKTAAFELGLTEGIPVSYRAGDQPNNAFSLNVLNPGEAASTAGTSGVIYGVTSKIKVDGKSRVNNFAHVNFSGEKKNYGVLLCINGTGILNSWLKKNFASDLSYGEMNQLAEKAGIGAEGISILPFGNGAERVLENKNIGSHILGLDFNRHSKAHIFRAAQEGIAFSFKYGFDIMKKMGVNTKVIRAGKANLFLSPVFAQSLSDITGLKIELYNTDGAQGAARGAAIGAGFYKSPKDAFSSLRIVNQFYPDGKNFEAVENAYNLWLKRLKKYLKS